MKNRIVSLLLIIVLISPQPVFALAPGSGVGEVGDLMGLLSHRFPKHIREALAKELEEEGYASQDISKAIWRGLTWTDGTVIGFKDDALFNIAARVLNEVLKRPISADAVKAVLEYHEEIHRRFHSEKGCIKRLQDELSSTLGAKRYRELLEYFQNQYGEYKDETRLVEELAVNLYVERLLGNPLRLLDEYNNVVILEEIIPVIETHTKDIVDRIDVKKLRFGKVLNDLYIERFTQPEPEPVRPPEPSPARPPEPSPAEPASQPQLKRPPTPRPPEPPRPPRRERPPEPPRPPQRPVPEIKSGMQVKIIGSEILGVGTVISLEGNTIVIQFASGRKELVWVVVKYRIEVITQALSPQELWQRIVELDNRINSAVTFRERIELMAERNRYRVQLWELLKATRTGELLRWEEFSRKIGIDQNQLRTAVYDYFIEETSGDIPKIAELMELAEVALSVHLSQYVGREKLHWVRAIAKAKKGGELSEEERLILVRDLIERYLADPTFVSFSFKTIARFSLTRIEKGQGGCRIHLARIGDERIMIMERLLENVGKDKEVVVSTEFDPDYGWLFVVTGEGKTLYYKKIPGKNPLDLIDPVQETILDSIRPDSNIKPRPLTTGEFTQRYGHRVITEMVRHKRFNEPSLTLYPFRITAVKAVDRGMLHFGRIEDTRYATGKRLITVESNRLIPEREYRIQPYFSTVLSRWVFLVTEMDKEDITLIFSGREIGEEIHIHQLEGEELDKVLTELGKREESPLLRQIGMTREELIELFRSENWQLDRIWWVHIRDKLLDKRIGIWELIIGTGLTDAFRERFTYVYLRTGRSFVATARVFGIYPVDLKKITDALKINPEEIDYTEPVLLEVLGKTKDNLLDELGKTNWNLGLLREEALKVIPNEQLTFLDLLKGLGIIEEFKQEVQRRMSLYSKVYDLAGSFGLEWNTLKVLMSILKIELKLKVPEPEEPAVVSNGQRLYEEIVRITQNGKYSIPWSDIARSHNIEKRDLVREVVIYLIQVHNGDLTQMAKALWMRLDSFKNNIISKYRLTQEVQKVKGVEAPKATLKEIWDKIVSLDKRIDKSTSFQERIQLMEERNGYRQQLWDLLRADIVEKYIPWEKMAGELGIKITQLRILIYDYFVEVANGDIERIAGLMEKSTGAINVELKKYRLTRKLHWARALKKARDGEGLNEQERLVMVRELLGNLKDHTFPSFSFETMIPSRGACRINLATIGKQRIAIANGLKENLGVGKKVTLKTIFDPDYGWLFFVTDGEKGLYYRKITDKDNLDLIDPVQESILDSIEPKKNINGEPIKSRELPGGVFTQGYGQRVITEMVRCNRFDDPSLWIYPFQITAFETGGQARLYFGRLTNERLIHIQSTKLTSGVTYRITPQFNSRIGQWAFTVTLDGQDILIFSGKKKGRETNLYQLEEPLGLEPQPGLSPIEKYIADGFKRGEFKGITAAKAIGNVCRYFGFVRATPERMEVARVFFTHVFFEYLKGLRVKLDSGRPREYVLSQLRMNYIKRHRHDLEAVLLRYYGSYEEVFNRNKDKISEILGFEVDYQRDIRERAPDDIREWLLDKTGKAKVPKEVSIFVGDSSMFTLFRGEDLYMNFTGLEPGEYRVVFEESPDRQDKYAWFMQGDKLVQRYRIVKDGQLLAQKIDGKETALSPISLIITDTSTLIRKWLLEDGPVPGGKEEVVKKYGQILICGFTDLTIIASQELHQFRGQKLWISFSQDESGKNKFALVWKDREAQERDPYGYLRKFYIVKDGVVCSQQNKVQPMLYTFKDNRKIVVEGRIIRRREISMGEHIDLLSANLTSPDTQVARNALDALIWVRTVSGLDRLRQLLVDAVVNSSIQDEVRRFYEELLLLQAPTDEFLEGIIKGHPKIKWNPAIDGHVLIQVIFPDLQGRGVRIEKERLFKLYYKLLFFHYLQTLLEKYSELPPAQKKKAICTELEASNLSFYQAIRIYWDSYEEIFTRFSKEIEAILGFGINYRGDVYKKMPSSRDVLIDWLQGITEEIPEGFSQGVSSHAGVVLIQTKDMLLTLLKNLGPIKKIASVYVTFIKRNKDKIAQVWRDSEHAKGDEGPLQEYILVKDSEILAQKISGKLTGKSPEPLIKTKTQELEEFLLKNGPVPRVHEIIIGKTGAVQLLHTENMHLSFSAGLAKYTGKCWATYEVDGNNKLIVIWPSEEGAEKKGGQYIRRVYLVKDGVCLAQVINGEKTGRKPIAAEEEPYRIVGHKRLKESEIAQGMHNTYLLNCLDDPKTRKDAAEALKLMRNEERIIELLRKMDPYTFLPNTVQRNLIILEILEAIGIVNEMVLKRVRDFTSYGNNEVQQRALGLLIKLNRLFYAEQDPKVLEGYKEGAHYLTDAEIGDIASPLTLQKLYAGEGEKFKAEFPDLDGKEIERELSNARVEGLSIEELRSRLRELKDAEKRLPAVQYVDRLKLLRQSNALLRYCSRVVSTPGITRDEQVERVRKEFPDIPEDRIRARLERSKPIPTYELYDDDDDDGNDPNMYMRGRPIRDVYALASLRYRLFYDFDLSLHDYDLILQDIETLIRFDLRGEPIPNSINRTNLMLLRLELNRKASRQYLALFTTKPNINIAGALKELGLDIGVIKRGEYEHLVKGPRVAPALLSYVNADAYTHKVVLTIEENYYIWQGLLDIVRFVDNRRYPVDDRLHNELRRIGLDSIIQDGYIDLSHEVPVLREINIDRLTARIIDDEA